MDNSQNEILLYVGCGNHRMKGFTHVEINVGKQFKKGGDVGAPEILADITEHIHLPDNSVKLVFSRATLEHLTYNELLNHFLECHRLLKKGGAIRMIVPNFDLMIQDYQNEIFKKPSEVDNNLPCENHTDLFISRVLYHDHYYLHNLDTLSRALKKTGFSEVREAKPGDSRIEKANSELLKAETGRSDDDIIVEAIKSDSNPSVVRYNKKYPESLLAMLLAKYFNIKISRFIPRKPTFPSRLWFKEKALMIKSRNSLKKLLS